MPKNFQVSKELCIVISQGDTLVAVVRKNGVLAFSETTTMGFDDIANLLSVISSPQPVASQDH